jgi:hypothetical protein
MLPQNHYRGHDSTPSAEYLADMKSRTTGALAKADPFLDQANALLAKIAAALDPKKKAEPLAKKAAPQTPLEKAVAAVEELAKAVASVDFADLESRLAAVEAS